MLPGASPLARLSEPLPPPRLPHGPARRSAPRQRDEEEGAARNAAVPHPHRRPPSSARLVSAAAPGMYQSPRRLCSALLLRDAPGLRRTLVPGPRRTLAPPVLGSRPSSPQLQAAASGAARSRPGTGEGERGMNGRRGLVPRARPRRRGGGWGADPARGGGPLSASVSDLPETTVTTVTPVANVVSFYTPSPGAGRLRFGCWLLVGILMRGGENRKK